MESGARNIVANSAVRSRLRWRAVRTTWSPESLLTGVEDGVAVSLAVVPCHDDQEDGSRSASGSISHH